MHAENSSGLGTDEVRRRHIIIKAVLVGLMAGLVGSLFRISLEWIEYARHAAVHNFSG